MEVKHACCQRIMYNGELQLKNVPVFDPSWLSKTFCLKCRFRGIKHYNDVFFSSPILLFNYIPNTVSNHISLTFNK